MSEKIQEKLSLIIVKSNLLIVKTNHKMLEKNQKKKYLRKSKNNRHEIISIIVCYSVRQIGGAEGTRQGKSKTKR